MTKPTRLSLRDLRSDALYKLLESPRGEVATLGDIFSLPDLAGWQREVLDVAIADLVADGLLADDEHGQPHALPRPGAAA